MRRNEWDYYRYRLKYHLPILDFCRFKIRGGKKFQELSDKKLEMKLYYLKPLLSHHKYSSEIFSELLEYIERLRPERQLKTFEIIMDFFSENLNDAFFIWEELDLQEKIKSFSSDIVLSGLLRDSDFRERMIKNLLEELSFLGGNCVLARR